MSAGGAQVVRLSDGKAFAAVTRDDLAVAFTEWAQRFEAEPEAFAEMGAAGTYGENCADYLIELLEEQKP